MAHKVVTWSNSKSLGDHLSSNNLRWIVRHWQCAYSRSDFCFAFHTVGW